MGRAFGHKNLCHLFPEQFFAGSGGGRCKQATPENR